MSKGLQILEGRSSEVSPAVKSVELILNHNYIKPLTEHIKNTKSQLRICSYLWQWYENAPDEVMQKFNVAILRAISRGVSVKVICDNLATKNMLKKQGIPVRCIDTKTIMHIKAVAVDRELLAMGSHNLSSYGMTKNYEASVFISEYEPIEQFITYFDAIWEQLSEN